VSETWWKYVERITGCAHQDRIAQHTEIEPSSVWQWKSRHNRPKAEHVITFARAYHRPPVEALIAAGYLDPTDVSVDPTEFNEVDEVAARPLREVSTDELIAELRRRLRY
jgi:transcriptional regulator with XRE-family HTH domain